MAEVREIEAPVHVHAHGSSPRAKALRLALQHRGRRLGVRVRQCTCERGHRRRDERDGAPFAPRRHRRVARATEPECVRAPRGRNPSSRFRDRSSLDASSSLYIRFLTPRPPFAARACLLPACETTPYSPPLSECLVWWARILRARGGRVSCRRTTGREREGTSEVPTPGKRRRVVAAVVATVANAYLRIWSL